MMGTSESSGVETQEVGTPAATVEPVAANESVNKPAAEWLWWQLILLWFAAIGWLFLMEWCITNVDVWLQLDQPTPAVIPWILMAFGRVTARFVVRIVQGVVLFVMLAWPYRRAFQLIVHSVFKSDAAPHPREGSMSRFAFRLLETAIYYSNLLSLSALRRFVYVAFNPFFSRGWRPSFLDLGPDRIIRKLQVYIETEMLSPKKSGDTSSGGKDSDGEYGERIADKYVNNLKSLDAGGVPTLDCKTCFDIFGDNRDRIDSYLEAQHEIGLPPKFLCRIDFDNGYLAPTYLVSGLLDEFDEDWTKLVKAYPDKLMALVHKTDPLYPLPELRKLQSFIWDCWVQWGPSVPVVSSDRWTAGTVALQFGYGDESNSLPLVIRSVPATGSEAGSPESVFQTWEATVSNLRKSRDHAGWAWPVKVSGRLQWHQRDVRNQRFCEAQHDSSKSDDDGWLVFEADEIKSDPGGPLFYSAYIWVLIGICRSTADDPSTDTDDVEACKQNRDRGYRLIQSKAPDQWRCLIPFFQHGNIAEVSVFNDIKRELAYKTVDSLLEQLRRARTAGENWLHFAFVAAYDDNGDSNASAPVAKPPGDSIATLLNAARQHRLDQSVEEDKELFDALHFQSDAWPSLTACQLPQVVRTYLDQIEGAVKG